MPIITSNNLDLDWNCWLIGTLLHHSQMDWVEFFDMEVQPEHTKVAVCLHKECEPKVDTDYKVVVSC